MSSSFPSPGQGQVVLQKPQKPFWRKPWVWVIGALLLIFGIAGSQQSETESNSVPSVTSEESVTVETRAPQQTSETDPIAISQPPETRPAPEPVQQAAPALMPVIFCGMDLQAAQDLVQTTGVFYSQSVDATGEGRMQVRDRNWTVLYADPDPGTPIGEGDVVFFVVKDEEFNGC